MRTLLLKIGMAACIAATTAFGQIDWTPANSSTQEFLIRVTWSHGQLLAFTGLDTLLTSPDGITWTKSWTNCPLSAVTWAEGKYVAVGDRPYEDLHRHSTGSVFTSLDGKTWTVLQATPHPYSIYLNDIVWADTQFVAVGEPSIILTSPDGRYWVPRTRIPNVAGYYRSVEWTGSLLVTVGVDQGTGVDRSAVLTSPDGVEWETRATGGKNVLSDVVWTGNLLVAVGNKGTILTSPDGITWTSRNSGTDVWLTSIVWTGHQLVVLGGNFDEEHIVLTSPDGVNWTNRTPARFGFYRSLAWTGQRLVGVGGDGRIITSLEDPSTVRPSGSLNHDFRLRMDHGEIRYTLPGLAQGKSASVNVYDISGKSIFSLAVPPDGEGRVTIRPLARGTYLFSLQADGGSGDTFKRGANAQTFTSK